MTISSEIRRASALFGNSSTPLLDAELLLGFVLKKDRSYFRSHPETLLTEVEVRRFQTLIEERKQGKPVAYITHEKEFFGRSFYVDERVLIPRPETEEMVELVMEHLKSHRELKTVIDVGTGSGCIAITLALEFPDRKVFALEISASALTVAQLNKERYTCENLLLIRSHLLSKLPTPSSKLILIANLPYIGTETNHFISEETETYEPHQALFGGSDGLDLYRRLWREMKEKDLNIAALFMEIGFGQAETIEKEGKENFPELECLIKKDLAGVPRIVMVTKK